MTTTRPALRERLARDIATLETIRRKAADLSAQVLQRDLDCRQLQERLEHELHRGNKAEAEKAAKAHPEMVAHKQKTIELTREKDYAFAEAEGRRFHLQMGIADLQLLSLAAEPELVGGSAT